MINKFVGCVSQRTKYLHKEKIIISYCINGALGNAPYGYIKGEK